ncbi:MAG: transcriptional regulator, partial [Acidimicrobiia bacterium]
MAHEDGTIHASELYRVAEACGQTADQVRSCLRRLVAEGLFVRRGSGADARFEATPAGLKALGTSL